MSTDFALLRSIMTKHGRTLRSLHGLLLVAALAGAAACDSAGDADAQRDPPPIPEDDVAFIDHLVPHHATAIMMADEVLERGSDAEVRAMAAMMKTAQQEEIDLMLSKRSAITGRQTTPTMDDPHADGDMAEMSGLSGLELDRTFLRDMIPHHAGAVSTAHRALPNLADAELRALAESTVKNQTREAAKMLDKLEALGG